VKLLNHLGIHHDEGADNAKIDCLWCGKQSLNIDSEAPNAFQCFSCKESGNAYTLIRKFYEGLPSLGKQDAIALTNKKQGIKPLTLKNMGVKKHRNDYYIPIYNQKGNLVALHKYHPATNIVYNGPKPISLSVIGLQTLSSNDTVYIAEGHWDYMIARQIISLDDYNVLGSCGSYFPTNFLPLLDKKNVVVMFDHDNAGREGVDYIARHLKSSGIKVNSLAYLDWSKITIPSGTIPDKFDIRDLYNTVKHA